MTEALDYQNVFLAVIITEGQQIFTPSCPVSAILTHTVAKLHEC